MKHILTILLTAAVVCGFGGCSNNQNGTVSETSATTISETMQASETTVNENLEETGFVTEFEITDWTMEELLSDVEINGVKLSLPCSYEELAEHFDLQIPKLFSIYYDTELKKYCYIYEVRHNESLILKVQYYSDTDEGNPTAEDMTDFFVCSDYTGENACLFRFGEINNSNMSQDEVEKVLGDPNVDSYGESRYIFGNDTSINQININYDKNNYVEYIYCYWNDKGE